MSKQGKKKVLEIAEVDNGRQEYKPTLHALQVELVKLQRHFVRCDDRVLALFEGRDVAGMETGPENTCPTLNRQLSSRVERRDSQ